LCGGNADANANYLTHRITNCITNGFTNCIAYGYDFTNYITNRVAYSNLCPNVHSYYITNGKPNGVTNGESNHISNDFTDDFTNRIANSNVYASMHGKTL